MIGLTPIGSTRIPRRLSPVTESINIFLMTEDWQLLLLKYILKVDFICKFYLQVPKPEECA